MPVFEWLLSPNPFIFYSSSGATFLSTNYCSFKSSCSSTVIRSSLWSSTRLQNYKRSTVDFSACVGFPGEDSVTITYPIHLSHTHLGHNVFQREFHRPGYQSLPKIAYGDNVFENIKMVHNSHKNCTACCDELPE